MAAVVKDSFLEEWGELADCMLGEGQTDLINVQWRCRRLQHHREEVPQVFLGKKKKMFSYYMVFLPII